MPVVFAGAADGHHNDAIRLAPIAKPMRASLAARASRPAKYPASARSAPYLDCRTRRSTLGAVER